MRVLHVNNVDLHGRSFNGYDLIRDLEPYDIDCRQVVLRKISRNPRVTELLRTFSDDNLQKALERVERSRSMDNLLFPWGRVLTELPEFQAADVVHYHLIHNRMLSILDLPELFALKPSVWTFHDPWPLTGHCVYPEDCEKWRAGCTHCPRLGAVFPMQEDRADKMWRLKQLVYRDLDVDIVVASEFMRRLVGASPLTTHFPRVHHVPFGVRADDYLPEDARANSRARLGIPADDFVLVFRSTAAEYKGLRYVIEALQMRAPDRPTTLIAVDTKGLLRELPSTYDIVEFGWLADASLYRRILSASDVLLMPSTAEAFGLMAVEAMAAGLPVISFEGTSLPEVTHAPDCGIAVPMGDSVALREAINRLGADPDEVRRRGSIGREIVRERYSHTHYLESLVGLYKAVHAAAGSTR